MCKHPLYIDTGWDESPFIIFRFTGFCDLLKIKRKFIIVEIYKIKILNKSSKIITSVSVTWRSRLFTEK